MEDLRERLAILTQAAMFDDCVASPEAEADGRGFFAPQPADARPVNRSVLPCVSHHARPDGRRETVLKVLQTSLREQLPVLRVPGRPRHPPHARHPRRDGPQLRPDAPGRPGRRHVPILRHDRHEPDDGRDAGDRGAGAGKVRLSRLRPSEAAARRRSRAMSRRAVQLADRVPRQPRGADARAAGAPRAEEAIAELADPLALAAAARTDSRKAIAAGRRRAACNAQPGARWGTHGSASPPSSSSARRARATASC